MNNKKGGFGAKLLLVLVLMIASAVGGAYGYRVLDGKLAVRDAQKYVDSIRVSDYDSEEAVQIETFKQNVTKDLETASTRKEVYEILESFKEDVDKIMTKTEKELEEARKAVNEAQNRNNNNNNNSGGGIFDNNNNNNNDNNYNNDTGDNQNDTGSENSDSGSSSSGSLLGNLFGNNNNSDNTDEDDGDPFN